MTMTSVFRSLRLPRWPISHARRREWQLVLAKDPSAALSLVPWMLSQRASRSPLKDGMPWITFKAQRWLAGRVHPQTRAFEWGSGGSTLYLARRVREVVSVEHDAGWYAGVQALLAAGHHTNTNYRLIQPKPLPPGSTSEYVSGHGPAMALDFEPYVTVIREYPDAYFDLILIDGRARTACLRAAWPKVRVGGHILFDNSDYPRYQAELVSPAGFERREFPGVSPYRGAIYTASTVWHRTS
jgi:predicted O-methyltransferase YrrM